MDAGANGEQHLDEGTIHAWLDDALDATSAARVEAHVAECAECSAAVAEARGLIAGASRVVQALDDERVLPAASPAWGQSNRSPSATPLWRMLHVTPARATIAATLLVALGLTLTLPRHAAREQAMVDTEGVPAMAASRPARAAQDTLLKSAIQRNVAAAQPTRIVEPNPTPAVTIPPVITPDVTTADAAAPMRVAEGRAKALQARSSAGAAADQSRTAAVPVAKEPQAPAAVLGGRTSASAPTVGVAGAELPPTANAAVAQSVQRTAGAPECYRLESPEAGATWGTVALPVIVELTPSASDSTRGSATAFSAASRADFVNGAWKRLGADTLQLDLRRLGYAGRLVLGGSDPVREGTMRSGVVSSQLEAVVVTSEPEVSEPAKSSMRKTTKRARPAADAASARADSAALPTPALPGAAVSVSAHRVSCR